MAVARTRSRPWPLGLLQFGTRDFDIFDKVEVNGPDAHPLYKFLRQQQPISSPGASSGGRDGAIEWNYVSQRAWRPRAAPRTRASASRRHAWTDPACRGVVAVCAAPPACLECQPPQRQGSGPHLPDSAATFRVLGWHMFPAPAPRIAASLTRAALLWVQTKFLINREGQAVKRYKPAFDPLEFEGDVSGSGGRTWGRRPRALHCCWLRARRACPAHRAMSRAAMGVAHSGWRLHDGVS